MKVGRVKDPLYKDSYLGITPPTFTPPLEPFEGFNLGGGWRARGSGCWAFVSRDQGFGTQTVLRDQSFEALGVKALGV